MNLEALKAELTDDPLERGYSGMSDAEAATSLNTVDCTRNRTTMTGSEIVNAIDSVEWAALSDAQQQTFWNIAHLGTVDPCGVEATMLISVFGAGSGTIAALAAARTEDVSRANELGIGVVFPGDVENARM
jgi:hypothetical protein